MPTMMERLRLTPSGAFIALLMIALAYTLWQTYSWSDEAARLPRVIALSGLALGTFYVLRHLVRPSRGESRIMDIGRTKTGDSNRVMMGRTVKALGSTVGLVAGIWLIGFQIALPLYVLLYLLVFGRTKWWIGVGWAVVFLVLIYGFFDLIIHIPWIDPVLEDVLPDILKGRETITQFLR